MLINELAHAARLSKDGIRHYEQMGLIASSPRRAGSRTYRDYDQSVLKTIEQIRQAQRLGFTLKEIRDLLKVYGSKDLSRQQTIDLLEARLVVIHERQNSLREVEQFIRDKLNLYRNAPSENGDASSPDVNESAPAEADSRRVS